MHRACIDNIDNNHDGAANHNDSDCSSDHDFCSSSDHHHYFAATDCPATDFTASDGGSGLHLFAHYEQR